MKRNFLIIIALLSIQFCFPRDMEFSGSWAIYKNLEVKNLTKESTELDFFGKEDKTSSTEYINFASVKIDGKENKKIQTKPRYVSNFGTPYGGYPRIFIRTSNDNITCEIHESGNKTKVIVKEKPKTFEKVQKYELIDRFDTSTYKIKIDENTYYEINCKYVIHQKNPNSERFKTGIIFYNYELGTGEKGTYDYIRYKSKLIYKHCFTDEQIENVTKKVYELYQLNKEFKERIEENKRLNPSDLTYNKNAYPILQFFSEASAKGKKYIANDLNYYEINPIGNDDYELIGRGTLSRGIFHAPAGLGRFTISDTERIVQYLGTTDVITNRGYHLTLPYFECLGAPKYNREVASIVAKGGNWDKEIEISTVYGFLEYFK